MNKMDRYVVLGQLVGEENVIAVKAFSEGTTVTSESIFTVVTEEICGGALDQVPFNNYGYYCTKYW